MIPSEKMAQCARAPPLNRLKSEATPPADWASATLRNHSRRISAFTPGVVIAEPARTITIIASVKSTRWRSSGILKMLVKAEIIGGQPNGSPVESRLLSSGSCLAVGHHDGAARLLDLLSGGRADAIHLEVKLLADLAAAEDLNTVERAPDEAGATEQLFVDGRAVVETLFQIVEVDDAVNCVLNAALLKPRLGSRRCSGI